MLRRICDYSATAVQVIKTAAEKLLLVNKSINAIMILLP